MAYHISGLGITIAGDPGPAKTAIETMFEICPTEPSDATGDGLALTVESHFIDRADFDAMVPAWLREPARSVAPSDEPKMIYGDQGRCATVAHTELVFCAAWIDADPGRIVFVTCAADVGYVPVSPQSVLVPMLREVLLGQGRILLHGAAAAVADGTGVAVFADGGGGKTTTALSLLRQGAGLVADDLIILSLDGGETTTVAGIPEPVNLTNQTIGFFSELAEHLPQGQLPGGSKARLDPRCVYGPECMPRQTRLDVGYFVSVDADGPAVAQAATGRALGGLVKAHTFARGQRMTEAVMDRFCRLIATMPIYDLRTGFDPVGVGEWLAATCASHAAGESR